MMEISNNDYFLQPHVHILRIKIVSSSWKISKKFVVSIEYFTKVKVPCNKNMPKIDAYKVPLNGKREYIWVTNLPL